MNHETKIDGNDNIVVQGNNNVVGTHHGSKDKEFNIPVDDNFTLVVKLGRWLYNKLTKKQFYWTVISVFILSLLALFGWVYLITQNHAIDGFGTIILKAVSILLISTLLMVSGWILRFSKTRTCEKCNKHFAYIDHKPHKHLNQGKYNGKIIHHIKQFLKCDFCSHEAEYEYYTEEDIPAKD